MSVADTVSYVTLEWNRFPPRHYTYAEWERIIFYKPYPSFLRVLDGIDEQSCWDGPLWVLHTAEYFENDKILQQSKLDCDVVRDRWKKIITDDRKFSPANERRVKRLLWFHLSQDNMDGRDVEEAMGLEFLRTGLFYLVLIDVSAFDVLPLRIALAVFLT